MDRHETPTTQIPTTQLPAADDRAARRFRRRFVVAASAVTLLALAAGAVVVGDSGDDSSPSPAAATATSLTGTDAAKPAVAPDSKVVHDGKPGSADNGESEGDVGGNDEAPEPAAPGELAVSTNLIKLPSGTWTGEFEVRNDGGSPIEWKWAGSAGIEVSQTSGMLDGGESVVVSFTVDHTVLPAGKFLFANCVFTDDAAKDVWIEGTKTIKVNPGVQLPKPQIKP